ncbi:hypothetical protein [Dictyobacter aurantiacus]|uniref:Uncharacterized protein n=1 Tax=Dictyobacter aurantiacus TaxID=1936993 RepID=A0A401ZDB1_9CHLR|nr:hypothetical protein [Dictyobacter aurantiacus]GCE04835.1 hypothetical protein KDAU_21640 [Dictyobacter aurantiacus]
MSFYDENTLDGQSALPYRSYEQYGPYVDAVPSTKYSPNPYYQQNLQQALPPPARTAPSEKIPGRSPRMPKSEALALARRWKRALVAGSLVAFGVLSGLVFTNAVSANSNQQTPANNNNNNTNVTTPSDNGGFFNGNNNNNQGQGQDQGGYGFGNNNSTQQPAISGTHAS